MSAACSGLLVLDKPTGVTSFDCVALVRKVSGQEHVGHAGTLDPLASGVLLMLLGDATREQERFMLLDKQYRLAAHFGLTTETGDRLGRVVHEYPDVSIEADRLQTTLDSFVGVHWQTPPRYAALKYKGKKYYDWALEGTEIPRAPRRVEIYSFNLLSYCWPRWEAIVVCSRGTYIRSLVEDVADYLGTGACLQELVRERIGPYARGDAFTWDQLKRTDRSNFQHYCHETFSHNPRHV